MVLECLNQNVRIRLARHGIRPTKQLEDSPCALQPPTRQEQGVEVHEAGEQQACRTATTAAAAAIMTSATKGGRKATLGP